MDKLGKIICTLGPASNTEDTILNLAKAGMVVARLNFSHDNHLSHAHLIELIRKVNKSYKKNIKILGDLEGHRLRIGFLNKPMMLKQNDIVTFVDVNSKSKGIPIDSDYDLGQIQSGMDIFINDGFIHLEAISSGENEVKAKVITAGLISTKKGINIPKATFKTNFLTPKDKKDIAFSIEHKINFIAQSFVRNAMDINRVSAIVKPKLSSCKIISKIENHDGVKNIDSIIDKSDGIMVARGDLGVSMPLYQIPYIQKHIIKLCNSSRKFVITATQMLESMIEHSRPTRAEVSDVANAVLDGSDYIMLSGETAIGKHPVQSVKIMKQIVDYNLSRSK